ncbi:MAG: tetratricopeptide repeat protein, partial [Anaerolineaceae bacterium]|nr:tetratricopeptide repeat protein [Anaerolineaceae bacterium]
AILAETIALKFQSGQGDIGSLDKAVDLSRKAMELGSGLLETHRARGLVLELTDNYEEAAREYEAAIAINTNIADQHLALGRTYRFLEQYDKAVEEFNKASGLNPTDPMPLIHISRTYATVGEWAKAIQYAQQAVKVRPSDPYLHGNLGVMLYRNRHYADALPYLRLAVRGGVTEDGTEVRGLPLDYGRVAEYYFTYGLALARAGECGEGLQISQLLIDGVPNDETSVYNAKEMVTICKEIAGTPRPKPTSTPATDGGG